MDSGFGPFGLCRLAYETGGLYFTVHPNRKIGQNDSAVGNGGDVVAPLVVLRPARDAELPARVCAGAATITRMVKSNRACAALVEASRLSATTPMENVRLRFPRVDDGQFARDLSNAQRTAAKLEPKIDALVAILRQGERDRDKITNAALAGRLRPGDRPGAGRERAHRRLQRDAGRGQAGPQVQGRAKRYVGAAAGRLGDRQQRARQRRRRRQNVSGARRRRARRHALGAWTPKKSCGSRSAGNGTSDSPTSPAAWPTQEGRNRPRPERPDPPRKPRRDPPAL